MSSQSVAERVTALLEPAVTAQGFELYDVEYLREGKTQILRLYIDKDGGVGLDDCECVSRAVEAVLDINDPVPSAYVLEVSSPGIERKLKKDVHFSRYAGEMVELRLFKPVDGQKKHKGILKGLTDGCVVIEDERGAERRFEREAVSACRLSVF